MGPSYFALFGIFESTVLFIFTLNHLKLIYILCTELLELSNEPKFLLIGPCIMKLRNFEYQNVKIPKCQNTKMSKNYIEYCVFQVPTPDGIGVLWSTILDFPVLYLINYPTRVRASIPQNGGRQHVFFGDNVKIGQIPKKPHNLFNSLGSPDRIHCSLQRVCGSF